MTDAKPVLDQLNIVVPDMGAAVEFYELLGVEIPDTLAEWQPHHREFGSGHGIDADLDSQSFAPIWNRGWPVATSGVVIGFRVDTREAVDETHARMVAAGHRSQQEPYDAFWGARYAVIEGPGASVGIMSPADGDRRTAPPDPPS